MKEMDAQALEDTRKHLERIKEMKDEAEVSYDQTKQIIDVAGGGIPIQLNVISKGNGKV